MPPVPPTIETLATAILAGQRTALARGISVVENQRAGFADLLGALHARTGRARRIGITGPPGAGKSTLTALLVAAWRTTGQSVAVIAVDPTSPFTGGALLGDRIRMEEVALDPGVYIRSLATRGSLGGLSAATRSTADVLDAFGFDVILMETVGVGQSELDIARSADSTIVMLVPESGDSIQTLKAGLMEIADLFVVNKADRPGADRLRMDIEVMLGMRGGHHLAGMPAHHGVDLGASNPARRAREAAAAEQREVWTPPVLRTVAAKGEGTAELLAAIDRHFRFLHASGVLHARRRQRLREQIVEHTERRIRGLLWSNAGLRAWLDAQLPGVESGAISPFAVAEEILARSAGLLTRTQT